MQTSAATDVPLPGDLVWIRRRRWRVDRALRDRSLVRLEVSVAGLRRTFLAPPERVQPAGAAAVRVVRKQQGRALIAAALGRSPDPRLPLALLHADADILPHQLEPALAIGAGHARLLIADEVGLGKTIQAGLIVAELLRRAPALRALILVPSQLKGQWTAELGRRFGIECVRGDRAGVDGLLREGAFGANPWSRSGVWLASLDFLKQRHVLETLPDVPWDLLIVDEAHTVSGNSDRHEACQHLARKARYVVLLTATPHSGDAARFARLLALGASQVSEPPVVFRRTRHDVGMTSTRRIRWPSVRLTGRESSALDELFAFERAVLRASSGDTRSGALLLLSIFRKRALSTFAALHLSINRRLSWLEHNSSDAPSWTQASLLFDQEGEEMDVDERTGLTARIGLDSRHEKTWLRRLSELSSRARLDDSKIMRVCRLLERSNEPVVVFTEYRDSLEALQGRLRRARQFAVLHGGQSSTDQRSELGRYVSGAASVLLATDVAGQGLNLHTRGRWVVSLELPWNPVRLEQRLGRVDRIGQSRTPHLTILVAQHTAEKGLLSHLARRVLHAQRGSGAGVLRDVLPPEGDVRTAVFTGQTTIGSSPVAESRSRWQRTAAVSAQILRRRRRLAGAWRGAQEHRGVVRVRGAGPQRLLCSLPILNGAGEPVYRLRYLVAHPDVNRFREEIRLEELWPLIELEAGRALQKLERRAGRTLARMTRREDELSSRWLLDRGRRESQPGLFDSREARKFQADRDELDHVLSARQSEAERQARNSLLRFGRLEVEFVLAGGI